MPRAIGTDDWFFYSLSLWLGRLQVAIASKKEIAGRSEGLFPQASFRKKWCRQARREWDSWGKNYDKVEPGARRFVVAVANAIHRGMWSALNDPEAKQVVPVAWHRVWRPRVGRSLLAEEMERVHRVDFEAEMPELPVKIRSPKKGGSMVSLAELFDV